MGKGSKKTDYGGFFVIQIPVPEKQEILIGWLPVNLLTNPSKSVVCIHCQSSCGKTFQLKMADYEELLSRVCNDVNKTDRPNTTPTVRAICTFAVYFRSFDLFATSLLFMKGISYCVIKRKLEPLDRAKVNFKRSQVCMISTIICMFLRWVWHLYNLPFVSVLFWLISIARFVSKYLLSRDKM